MTTTKRQPGERRWGLPVNFPFTDSAGTQVEYERRKATATLEDLLILFSELPSIDPQRRQ